MTSGPGDRAGSRLGEGPPFRGYRDAPAAWIVPSTLDTFDRELRPDVPVLVEFWAPWCRPSWVIHPLVARIAAEYAGRLKVAMLDVGDAPAVARRYGVYGIPLFVLFRDDEELDRRVGTPPIGHFRQWLESHLASASEQR